MEKYYNLIAESKLEKTRNDDLTKEDCIAQAKEYDAKKFVLHEDLAFLDQEKIEIFESEIESLAQKNTKNFLKKALLELPEYFWYSSYKSEYGQTVKEDNYLGGLVKHAKKTAKFAEQMCKLYGGNDTLRDILVSAGILHDGFIYGPEEKVTTDPEINDYHILYPRTIFEERGINKIPREPIWRGIISSIEAHTGQDAIHPEFKPQPGNPGFLLHLSDYYASTLKSIEQVELN